MAKGRMTQDFDDLDEEDFDDEVTGGDDVDRDVAASRAIVEGRGSEGREFTWRDMARLGEGSRDLPRPESRALSPNVLSAGGVLLSQQGPREILEVALQETSVMRRLSRRIDAVAHDEHFATLDDSGADGYIVAPNTAVDGTAPAFVGKASPGRKFGSGTITAAEELVEDSQDLAVRLLAALGRRVSRRQNRSFTVGTIAGDAEGIVYGCAQGKVCGSATVITIDDVIDLIASVNSSYSEGVNGEVPVLMMHPLVLAVLRKLRDAEGGLQWELSGLGRQGVALNSHMPSSITAGTRPILYGRFDLAYGIRAQPPRLVGVMERYRDRDQMGYQVFQVADGAVLDSQAVKALEMAAA